MSDAYKRIIVVRNAYGRTGLSAYQQAVLDGYTGTPQEYAAAPVEATQDALDAAAAADVARDAAYAARDAAVSATTAATTATTAANTATTQANAARDGANAATTAATTATTAATTATSAAVAATSAAVTATTQANNARDGANGATTAATTATTQANAARDAATAATTAATTATTAATTATTAATTATTQANAARDGANTASAYVNDLLTQQIGQTWVNYSTARVLTSGDNGKLIAMTSTGINFVYADAGLPADFRCEVMRLTGAGEVIVVGGTGATVTGQSGQTAMTTVNASGILRNVVQDALVLSGGNTAPSTTAINRSTFSKVGASGQALAFLF